MSDHDDDDIIEFTMFEPKELVLVRFNDETAAIGEFLFESDLGVCLNVTSKTDYRVITTVQTVSGSKKMVKSDPYLRELRRAIRMYYPWHRVIEISAAEEVYEEMQLKAFADSIDHNEIGVMDHWSKGPKSADELVNPHDSSNSEVYDESDTETEDGT